MTLLFRGAVGFGVLLVSLAACFADPAPVIHYAPAENLERIDVALINQAQSRIDMAAYVLTDRPVMQALARAAQRRVKIRIYLDAGRIGEREPTPLFLNLMANPDVEIRFKRAGAPLMHLKSYQVDGRFLRSGAANFSHSGLKRQDNDLIIVESPAAAAEFARRFDAIYATSEPLPRDAAEPRAMSAVTGH